MKYKIYYNGSICKPTDYTGAKFVVNLGTGTTAVSVDNGGSFPLPNGDTLIFNRKNGYLPASGARGIGLTLESGHEFIAVLTTIDGSNTFEAGFGMIYDFDWMYDNNNILKIYYIDDIYEIESSYSEHNIRVNSSLCYTFIIQNGYWQLTEIPQYAGTNLTLNSGEVIWVSGPACAVNQEPGVCFTRSSGAEAFGFYYRDQELLQETCNFYFGDYHGVAAPQDGDDIAIYEYTEDAYEYACDHQWTFTEDIISECATLLCRLRYSGGQSRWTVIYDNSVGGSTCSINDGGDIMLTNGDILHINEMYGDLTPWSYDYEEGVGMTLESGHEFTIFAVSAPNDEFQQSGFGVIYDRWWEYEPDEVIYRIYDTEPEDEYDSCGSNFYSEAPLLSYPHWALILRDGEWVMTNDPRYVGNTFTLNSGEKVTILNECVSYYNEIGISFALDSGNYAMAYYYRDGDMIMETANFAFGYDVGYAQDGDIIHIYDLGEDSYDAVIEDDDFSESNISNLAPRLCYLQYDDALESWVLLEDYS